MKAKILAALQTPLAFPQLEAIIYPKGRPDTHIGGMTRPDLCKWLEEKAAE